MEGHVIGLPSTGLFVKDGVLYRQTKKGIITARHQLSDVVGVKVVKGIDSWAIGFAVGATALAVAAYQFIPWAAWRWISFIVLVLIAAVCVASVHKHVLHLELMQGPVQYDVRDTAEEGIGFAVSLKALLRDARSASGTSQELQAERDATLRD